MKSNSKRYILFLIGIAILTLGVSLTVKSNIGAGSYDAINFVLADMLDVNVSTTIALTSFIFLSLSAILRRSFPRVITFITSLIMGLFTDLWVYLLSSVVVTAFFSKVLVFLIGTILICIGLTIYLIPKLPANPIDDFMVALTEKNISINKAKLGIDTSCILIAIILGGNIGIGTILLTLLVGPVVGVLTTIVSRYSILNNTHNFLNT